MPRTDSLPFPLIWELDSILPHPESAEFRAVLTDYRSRLTQLAEEADHLPPLNAEPQNVSAWKRLLTGIAAVEMLASDLSSFAGCHAAADAANKLFQQLEGELSGARPAAGEGRDQCRVRGEGGGCRCPRADVGGGFGADRVAIFLRRASPERALRLPKEREQLANDLAVDAIHAWGRLYDRLSGELKVKVMEKGRSSRSPRAGHVRFAAAGGSREQFLRGGQSLDDAARLVCRCAQSHLRLSSDEVPASRPDRR